MMHLMIYSKNPGGMAMFIVRYCMQLRQAGNEGAACHLPGPGLLVP
jgi:hypothetical protein